MKKIKVKEFMTLKEKMIVQKGSIKNLWVYLLGKKVYIRSSGLSYVDDIENLDLIFNDIALIKKYKPIIYIPEKLYLKAKKNRA